MNVPNSNNDAEIRTTDQLKTAISEVVHTQKITDIHTHLFSPPFNELLLWGIDELLTYHYLIAEVFRKSEVSYQQFWSMTKAQQAELIWQTLFIENSPISEACRGVVTTLNELALDVGSRNLQDYRDYFTDTTVEDFIDTVFESANVSKVVMTNDPFDPAESPVWESGDIGDSRFEAALRMDVLINSYEDTAYEHLRGLGYEVDPILSSEKSYKEVRRFLETWIQRMDPKYMAVSLPPDFQYPDDGVLGRLFDNCILPISREFNVPFALMIGVKRAVNPQLKMAGDGTGKADLSSLETLLRENPDNKFLVTLLSRENQHELCVIGRKFKNLMIFGCWWFMNNPSVIEEITRERIELLGLSVIPQHSDARILDQLIYKWKHSRQIIADVLVEKYQSILDVGWTLTQSEIERDVNNLFGGNFERFLNGN
ncbi:MAG: glucuronate isomerase [Candidatus Poribacteria bacterium]|nr:glucuronate isomerase [Candidatus Poribacteria bacterium]